MPNAAIEAIAISTAGMKGTSKRENMNHVTKPPHITNSPWEKLNICKIPNTSVSPTATMAYIELSTIPLMSICNAMLFPLDALRNTSRRWNSN
jgi:hypothetical protein